MRMTKQELTEHTIAVWQQRSPRQLTKEDAREITENLTGFFAILAEWSRNEAHDHAATAADRAKRKNLVCETPKTKQIEASRKAPRQQPSGQQS